MSYSVIIPARYASTRLPGKPLLLIAGKPLLQHVYERARLSAADHVVIATDDERIQAAADAFGADVVMTRDDHISGTDRLAEASEVLGLDDQDIVVNLQGDEPMMPPKLLDQVAQALEQNEAEMATLCEPLSDHDLVFNPNIVKLVCNARMQAMYFSRAPIPWSRATFSDLHQKESLSSTIVPQSCFRHIGLYAYRVSFLKQYPQLSVCELEQLESLEQLRVLHHGYRIQVAVALADAGIGVDTEADLDLARKLIESL